MESKIEEIVSFFEEIPIKRIWESIKYEGKHVIVKCDICGTKSKIHIDYLNSQIPICVSKSCNTLEEVCREMVRVKNGIFVKLDTSGDEPMIYLNIPNKHEICVVTYEKLRLLEA